MAFSMSACPGAWSRILVTNCFIDSLTVLDVFAICCQIDASVGFSSRFFAILKTPITNEDSFVDKRDHFETGS